MGKSVRSVPRERWSQAYINSIIPQKQQEQEPIKSRPILTYSIEYDSLKPEETIKDFCSNIRSMLARYQYSKDQYALLEQEMQDLLHYIELTSDKNANIGYKLYKRLTEVRRERRKCKSEIDLLQPIYDAFNEGDKLNMLSQVQGNCRIAKQAIDNRVYSVRTEVLNPFLENR